MAGSGPLLKKTLTRIQKEKTPIRFLGYIQRRDVPQVLVKCQAGLIFSTKDTAREIAFPIKMLDYAACGLPVIATKVGDWGRLIDKEGFGVTVDEDHAAGFIDALKMLADKSIWLEKKRNCIDFAMRYQWCNVLKPMQSVLDDYCR